MHTDTSAMHWSPYPHIGYRRHGWQDVTTEYCSVVLARWRQYARQMVSQANVSVVLLNNISIGFAVFAQLTVVTNVHQTDNSQLHVCTKSPHLAVGAGGAGQ